MLNYQKYKFKSMNIWFPDAYGHLTRLAIHLLQKSEAMNSCHCFSVCDTRILPLYLNRQTHFELTCLLHKLWLSCVSISKPIDRPCHQGWYRTTQINITQSGKGRTQEKAKSHMRMNFRNKIQSVNDRSGQKIMAENYQGASNCKITPMITCSKAESRDH